MSFRRFDISGLTNAKVKQIKPPMLTPSTIIATWFYTGFAKVAPGTLGSLACYPLYYLVLKICTNYHCVLHYFIFLAITLFLLGLWAIDRFQKTTNTFDHSSVVIDEVIGMLVAFAFSFDYAYKLSKVIAMYISLSTPTLTFFLVFIVFRYFDIRKTFPINLIDRKLKNAFGVILDDMLAGVYTATVIYVAFRVLA